MAFAIPCPLQLEHDELHEQLRKATRESGSLGEAAKAVAKLMHPHFVKEEEYALPPLGLLPSLARGGKPRHHFPWPRSRNEKIHE